MTGGYTTMAALSNPMLARVWHYLHISADTPPLALDPIHAAPAIFAATASRFRGAGIAANWNPADEGFTIQPPADARAFIAAAVQETASWNEALQRWRQVTRFGRLHWWRKHTLHPPRCYAPQTPVQPARR